MRLLKKGLFSFCLFSLLVGAAVLTRAEDNTDQDSTLMKAVATDAGRMSPSEQKLFKQSIQSTKESVARDSLDVFYRDALDYYHQGQYDEALELLDNIYSVDPYYEDVGTLRETIKRLKDSHDISSKRGILDEYMHKGNAAHAAGQNVTAINYWKQALMVNASYEPAKKKIAQVNHIMAQKQYEAGYLYYHHGDLEQALDSWSNAIVLDPSYKHRGLLTLMSKVQLLLRRDQAAQMTARASQQYADRDLPGALQTYEDLLAIDPRNDDARRMSAKIKIQLGQLAYRAARDSLSQHFYAQAIKQFQESIKYGFEIQRSQKGIQDAEHLVESAQVEKRRAAKAATAASTATVTSSDNVPAAPAAPAASATPANPEEANAHYRESLAAIRSKDYHRAIEECEIASQLNPTDEHIYIACQRAKQEWNAMNSGRGAQ